MSAFVTPPPAPAAPAPAPAPAPARPAPNPAPPGSRSKSKGIDTFTRIWPRKKRKRGRSSMLKEFGLLRHVVAKVPSWIGMLQRQVVMVLQSLAHSLALLLVSAELLGLDVFKGRRVLARPLGSARRLMSLAYDCSLTALHWPLCFVLPEDAMVVWRRIALLQCSLGAVLHFSSLRWQTPSCEYRVPPLLILLCYFCAPWIGLCRFLLRLRPGDHLLGSLQLDCLVLLASTALRIGLFGRFGRPRMPKSQQPMLMRAADAAVLAVGFILLDIGLLRNAWIERRKNWKYIFCAVLIALPWPFWRQLLQIFREEKPKKVPTRKGRPTREEIQASIYGKLRPGVPLGADLPADAVEKLRVRRVGAVEVPQLREMPQKASATACMVHSMSCMSNVALWNGCIDGKLGSR
ncbi:unnamed protein product [Effrenium voratum]|nr:unnamed protein product [Effrenium voratum]